MESKTSPVVAQTIEKFGYAHLASHFRSRAPGRDTLTPQAIRKWAEFGVPAERVLEFERVTGVPRTKIRPDLYPSEERVA